jgi:hypothetical protein
MIPTKEQIQEEIKKLNEIKSKVVQRTLFGDDNIAAINAEIRVLEENMDEDEIYETFSEEEGRDHERDAALCALAWLETGETDCGETSLWEGWPLKEPK